MKKSGQLLLINFVLILAVACGERSPAKSSASSDSDKPTVDTTKQITKTIIFFGNSLTAGYGVEPSQAFPALIQRKIDSAGMSYKVINAGVSGETTAGGNSRIDWILQQKPDIFVLELGGNDGLRGIPMAETRKNLQSIIDKVKARYPQTKILLAGMLMPPNLGGKYTAEFREVFPSLAKTNNILLIPFLLKGVGGEVSLNQNDGIHPTTEGHKIVAENVWEILKEAL